MKFSDGMEFDLSGDLRPVHKEDGWYVVGQGYLLPVGSLDEAMAEIARLKAEGKGGSTAPAVAKGSVPDGPSAQERLIEGMISVRDQAMDILAVLETEKVGDKRAEACWNLMETAMAHLGGIEILLKMV